MMFRAALMAFGTRTPLTMFGAVSGVTTVVTMSVVMMPTGAMPLAATAVLAMPMVMTSAAAEAAHRHATFAMAPAPMPTMSMPMVSRAVFPAVAMMTMLASAVFGRRRVAASVF